MKVTLLVSILLLTFAFSLPAYEENFNDGEANDWVVVTGTWEVDNGEYHQIDPSGANIFSFYAVGDETWKDYTLEAKIMPLNTPYAGVIFRVMETGPGGNAPNWSKGHFISWLVGTGSGKGYSKVWKAMLGPEAMIEGSDGDLLELNEWSEIKVVLEGDSIQCYLNGDLQKEFNDPPDAILTGGIGLMTYGDTLFDDAIVTGPGIPGSAVVAKEKLAVTWGYVRSEIQ